MPALASKILTYLVMAYILLLPNMLYASGKGEMFFPRYPVLTPLSPSSLPPLVPPNRDRRGSSPDLQINGENVLPPPIPPRDRRGSSPDLQINRENVLPPPTLLRREGNIVDLNQLQDLDIEKLNSSGDEALLRQLAQVGKDSILQQIIITLIDAEIPISNTLLKIINEVTDHLFFQKLCEITGEIYGSNTRVFMGLMDELFKNNFTISTAMFLIMLQQRPNSVITDKLKLTAETLLDAIKFIENKKKEEKEEFLFRFNLHVSLMLETNNDDVELMRNINEISDDNFYKNISDEILLFLISSLSEKHILANNSLIIEAERRKLNTEGIIPDLLNLVRIVEKYIEEKKKIPNLILQKSIAKLNKYEILSELIIEPKFIHILMHLFDGETNLFKIDPFITISVINMIPSKYSEIFEEITPHYAAILTRQFEQFAHKYRFNNGVNPAFFEFVLSHLCTPEFLDETSYAALCYMVKIASVGRSGMSDMSGMLGMVAALGSSAIASMTDMPDTADIRNIIKQKLDPFEALKNEKLSLRAKANIILYFINSEYIPLPEGMHPAQGDRAKKQNELVQEINRDGNDALLREIVQLNYVKSLTRIIEALKNTKTPIHKMLLQLINEMPKEKLLLLWKWTTIGDGKTNFSYLIDEFAKNDVIVNEAIFIAITEHYPHIFDATTSNRAVKTSPETLLNIIKTFREKGEIPPFLHSYIRSYTGNIIKLGIETADFLDSALIFSILFDSEAFQLDKTLLEIINEITDPSFFQELHRKNNRAFLFLIDEFIKNHFTVNETVFSAIISYYPSILNDIKITEVTLFNTIKNLKEHGNIPDCLILFIARNITEVIDPDNESPSSDIVLVLSILFNSDVFQISRFPDFIDAFSKIGNMEVWQQLSQQDIMKIMDEMARSYVQKSNVQFLEFINKIIDEDFFKQINNTSLMYIIRELYRNDIIPNDDLILLAERRHLNIDNYISRPENLLRIINKYISLHQIIPEIGMKKLIEKIHDPKIFLNLIKVISSDENYSYLLLKAINSIRDTKCFELIPADDIAAFIVEFREYESFFPFYTINKLFLEFINKEIVIQEIIDKVSNDIKAYLIKALLYNGLFPNSMISLEVDFSEGIHQELAEIIREKYAQTIRDNKFKLNNFEFDLENLTLKTKYDACAICLEPLDPTSGINFLTPRGCDNHQFHEECLSGWIQQSHECPVCKRL